MLGNLQATMSELDVYGDKVIAFEAVKTSDYSRLVSTRQPLKPKTTQTFSPPAQKLAGTTDGIQDLRFSTSEAPVSNKAAVVPHPSADKLLSPQAGPNRARAVPSATLIGQVSGFTRFHDSVIDTMRTTHAGYSEVQIQDAIRQHWTAMGPTHRARTYQIHVSLV